MRLSLRRTAAVLLMLSLGSPAARADFIVVSGNVQTLSPPRDLRNGQTTSNTNVRAFFEKQDLTLVSAVAVDFSAPGIYRDFSDLPSAAPTIAAGTRVNSYLFHTDPADPPRDYEVELLFDAKILGVILRTSTLGATDSTLGLAQLTYDTSADLRGVDLAGDEDRVRLFATDGGRRLLLDFQTFGVLDEVRVVTAVAEVPEPASVVLCAAGCVGLAGFAFRRRPLPV